MSLFLKQGVFLGCVKKAQTFRVYPLLQGPLHHCRPLFQLGVVETEGGSVQGTNVRLGLLRSTIDCLLDQLCQDRVKSIRVYAVCWLQLLIDSCVFSCYSNNMQNIFLMFSKKHVLVDSLIYLI